MTFRFFRNCLKNTVQFVKQMSDTTAPVVKERTRYDGRIKKRNWEDRRSDRLSEGMSDEAKKAKLDAEGNRIKRRKYAMLLGYSGVDYFGMQRNPQMKTIEEDLLKALLKANLITEEAFDQVQTIQFQRAARTDKGVSAARQVVSLKLPEKIDVSLINKELPDQIKVFSAKRVTKGFNCKSNCDARSYIYMLPTLAFANFNTPVAPEKFRIDEETINNVNNVLKLFSGSKNFHNFTSRKLFKDPSAMRYIISFECGQPFVRKDIEFAVIKVKGQSFMLHQIRKMIGLTLAIVRGHTTTETISRSYTADRLDIPMAPGLGLVLDQVHYDKYNSRYGKDHDTLDWVENEAEVEEFKEKYIYPTIIDTEIAEKSMLLWLETLPLHSFSVRSDEVMKNDQKSNDKDSDAEEDEEEESNIKLPVVSFSVSQDEVMKNDQKSTDKDSDVDEESNVKQSNNVSDTNNKS